MADLVLGLAKSTVEGTLALAKAAMEEEEKLQKSVQRDLMLISDEFEMMHAFADDVTRTVVRQVRNMALDVEDCIESAVHLDNKPNWWRRMLPSCILAAAAPPAHLDDAVAGMELLKARIEAMGQRNMRYCNISNSAGSKHAELMHQQAVVNTTASNISGGALLGAVDPGNWSSPVGSLNETINWEEDELQVISVLGTVGTMSIIKKAYYDSSVCKKFRCRAWVKLMHPFNPHEFIRSLMAQFYKNNYQQQEASSVDCLELKEVTASTDGVLMEEFMKLMNNVNYLVVLEQVSNMVDWEAVMVYLPDKNNGSCIIVNTHDFEVATLCVGYPRRVSEVEESLDNRSVYVFSKKQHHAAGEFERNSLICKDLRQKQIKIADEWLLTDKLVGRDVDLICVPHCTGVSSVWGMPGVGKSSLIKHVYYKSWKELEHSDYDNGWVDVPRPFNLVGLSRALLTDVAKTNPFFYHSGKIRSIKDPIRECREYLRADCLRLIVIDGLQSTEEWDSVKAAWDLENTSLSIIVISNEESVAKYCASESRMVYNVKGLDADHAFELFKKVQAQWGLKSEWITEQERHNVHKCGGLPAVIETAALFLDKFVEEFQLQNDNFVSMLEANKKMFPYLALEGLFDWLLSYFRSCPDSLKPCIFYLSIFPLNYTIRRRRLVRRWIAEGYSRNDKQSTADENGEMSFTKLVNLCMIQVPRTAAITNKRMPLCTVNGFLREYIISRSMEENLVFSLEGHCIRNVHRTGRHLAIDKSWDRDRRVYESIDFSRLRSLTVFGKWESFFISDKTRLLRVLDLEDASSGVTNGEVEQMVKLLPRLKFLSLRRCRQVTHLPDSLGDLKQLQTLDIRETSVVKLPKSISKLEKLQYIRAGTNEHHQATEAAENSSPSGKPMSMPCSATTHHHHRNGVTVPRGISRLIPGLHTLGVIDIGTAGGEAILEDLKNLTQLHKLGVSGINQNNSDKFFSAISGLQHMESLSLEVQFDGDNQAWLLDGISEKTTENLQSLKLYRLVRQLPVWTKELQNLRKLSLQMTMVSQEGLDLLVGLPIQDLRLFLSEFQCGELHFGREAAFALAFLEISCNSRLQATITFHEREGDDGSVLLVLRISCCRVSTLRISGAQHLQHLQEVWLNEPCVNDDHIKKHFETELAKYPEEKGKPILRVEEPDSLTPWLMTSS